MVADNLRRRINISKSGMVLHQRRTIRSPRYESVRMPADLERRLVELERFIGWLKDALLGLFSSGCAVATVVYIEGSVYWQEAVASGVLAFLITTWIANFFFRNARTL